jgi:DNA-binding GntR family transcriptional regulator
LRQAAAEEEAAFARGDRGTGLRLSGEFHLLIALIAGNQRLFQFLRSLSPKPHSSSVSMKDQAPPSARLTSTASS